MEGEHVLRQIKLMCHQPCKYCNVGKVNILYNALSCILAIKMLLGFIIAFCTKTMEKNTEFSFFIEIICPYN